MEAVSFTRFISGFLNYMLLFIDFGQSKCLYPWEFLTCHVKHCYLGIRSVGSERWEEWEGCGLAAKARYRAGCQVMPGAVLCASSDQARASCYFRLQNKANGLLSPLNASPRRDLPGPSPSPTSQPRTDIRICETELNSRVAMRHSCGDVISLRVLALKFRAEICPGVGKKGFKGREVKAS